MCFDTTASNTGCMKSACVAIAIKLNRSLILFQHYRNLAHSIKKNRVHRVKKKPSRTLVGFVIQSSKLLFTNLSLDFLFLEVDLSELNELSDYQTEYINTIDVSSDNVKRAIALIENYNNYLKKNENQLQYLLQIAEGHKGKFMNKTKYAFQKPVINKKTIIQKKQIRLLL